MKLTKLTSALLVSGMTLTIGTSVAVNATSASASTVVSETTYEKVMSFTKADLNKATGVNLSAASINTVYNAMKKQATWTKLGYTKVEAKRITDRISASNYQTLGILKDIIANEGLQFKVVLINQPNYKTVNIGTIGEVAEPTTPTEDATPEVPVDQEDDEDVVTPEKPSNSALSSVVKDIEIDIEYKKLGDIEVDYEVKSDGRIKAELENKQTGIKIKDAAAQKAVEDLFVGLDAKTMSRTSIQDHVLTKLKASKSGLKKFEFEVKFADKSKVDFKIKY